MKPSRITMIVAVGVLASAVVLQAQSPNKTLVAPAFQATNTTGPDFIANATSGPPLQVSSTTQVNNLNADFVNGLHASAFAKVATANSFSALQTFTSGLQVGFSTPPSNPSSLTLFTPCNCSAGIRVFGTTPAYFLNSISDNYPDQKGGLGLTTGTNGVDFGYGVSQGDINLFVQGANINFNTGINPSPSNPFVRMTVTAAGNVGVGTTTPSNVFTIVQGGGHAISDGWDTYSSARWKRNIQTYPLALATVTRLRGVTYNRKSDGKPEVGLIAEEVANVVPQVVSYHDGSPDGLDYSRLTAVLVEAIKEQQKEIETLKARLEALDSQR